MALILGNKYKGPIDHTDKLVFFNEGKHYWNVFKPVLDELINQKKTFVYLTADFDDPGLQLDGEYCSSHYLGNMSKAFLALNKLKAKMCITTTPQLDILNWKRSKDVKHYCYLSHAPMDVHANKKYSFDYYDSVLCGNNYHIANLRQLERDRNSKTKILMKTGCTYYDLMEENKSNIREHVLLSPTWGERSFFPQYGHQLVEELFAAGHSIIYRPHPQSWISEKQLIESIQNKYKQSHLFEIDQRIDNSYSLSNAKIMITDISSGIIYDVAFLHKIPIIAVEHNWDDGGYESSNLNSPPSTKYLLEEVGTTINREDISNINKIINKVSSVTITKEIIDKHIFNFQRAGKVAATNLLSIFNEIN